PAAVGDVDQRAVRRAGVPGDVGDVVLAQLEPLDRHRGAPCGDVGDPAVGGGQAAARVQGDAAGQFEVERGAALEVGEEAVGGQAPGGDGEGPLGQAAAARSREAEGAAPALAAGGG